MLLIFMVPMDDGTTQGLVYAVYPELARKHLTWSMLLSLKPTDDVPWLCCGDFNDVLSPSNKWCGAPVNVAHLQDIHSTLATCSLVEVGFPGLPFTWSNMRTEPNDIEERLDFALINPAWTSGWCRT